MAMTRENARDLLFLAILPFIDGEMANAQTTLPGTVRGIDEVLSDAAALPLTQTEYVDLLNGLMARRFGQEVAPGQLASLLDFGVAAYLTAIGSPVVSGGRFSDRDEAMIALRESLIANNEYVASAGDSRASNPAAANGLILRRLAVDADGQTIEGGRRETVTFEVTQTAISGGGQRSGVGVLYGGAGAIDGLDRAGGTNRTDDVRLAVTNELHRGGVINGGFVLGGGLVATNPIPNDQTALGSPWVQVRTGTPTVVVDTKHVYGSLETSIDISGNDHALEVKQPFILPVGGSFDPAAPIDAMVVMYWDGSAQFTLTLTWGSKSQNFTHADCTSGAGLYYFHPDLDKDLFPVNFGGGSPMFSVKFTMANTGAVKLLYADTQRMVRRQGHYYSAWSLTGDTADGTTKSWADSRTFAGLYQRALLLAYGQGAEAYFPTAGSSLIAAPTLAAALTATHNGSALTDGGTVALGATSTSPQTVTIRFKNNGNTPAALGPHVELSATNASLSGGDLDAAALPLAPNTDSYVDVQFEITPAGAGAYDVDIELQDGTGGTFTFTVTGTAS